jgi:hypothetical protein
MAIFHISSWPFGFDRRLDVIFLADRNAAAGDDQVVIGRRAPQGIAGRFEIVRHGAEIAHFAAQAFEQGAQGVAVGVVDGARWQRLARLHQFVAGEKDANAHATINRQFRQAGRSGQRDVLRAQLDARLEDFGADRNVFAGAADVLLKARGT